MSEINKDNNKNNVTPQTPRDRHHNSSSSSSSTFTNKQKHNNLKMVRAELDKLGAQLDATDSFLSTACIQTNAIKKLGIYHSSLFMAVSQITEQSIGEIMMPDK